MFIFTLLIKNKYLLPQMLFQSNFALVFLACLKCLQVIYLKTHGEPGAIKQQNF